MDQYEQIDYAEMYQELEREKVRAMKDLLQMVHAVRDGKDFWEIADLLDRLGFSGSQIDEILNNIRLA